MAQAKLLPVATNPADGLAGCLYIWKMALQWLLWLQPGRTMGPNRGPTEVACAPCWRTRCHGARAVLAQKEEDDPFVKQILNFRISHGATLPPSQYAGAA